MKALIRSPFPAVIAVFAVAALWAWILADPRDEFFDSSSMAVRRTKEVVVFIVLGGALGFGVRRWWATVAALAPSIALLLLGQQSFQDADMVTHVDPPSLPVAVIGAACLAVPIASGVALRRGMARHGRRPRKADATVSPTA